jgi:SAM-dependent methyltransferase
MTQTYAETPRSVTTPPLPARYGAQWREPFDAEVRRRLRPGLSVLDVGAGANPVIFPQARPPGCTYTGLDIDLHELEKAPCGSYDEAIVADMSKFRPDLENQFDLVLSSWVLEHVPSLEAALDNCHRYLRPGGSVVSLFAGRFAAFAILNRVTPARIGEFAMKRLLGREPETVFHAFYDRTYYSALVPVLEKWNRATLIPLYVGAGYFAWSPLLRNAYLRFEDWALRTDRRDLATYYVLAADR